VRELVSVLCIRVPPDRDLVVYKRSFVQTCYDRYTGDVNELRDSLEDGRFSAIPRLII